MERNGFFKTFDGTRLFYSMTGEGPPIVFCYGLVCSKLHWQYQIDYFKKHNTVIWFDYRAHHNSDVPKDLKTLTVSSFARDLEALINELNLPEVVVAGHSMGVSIVLDFYKLAPKKVKGLILANGSARNALETFFGTNLLQYIVPGARGLRGKFPRIVDGFWKSQGDSWLTHRLVAWGGFNPGLAKEADIATYIKLFSQMDLSVTLGLLEDYERYDAAAWLHNVSVPTLIISGEKDKVIPRDAQELLLQLIPKSQLEVIRNGSHCPQMDIPELVNLMIERFLTKVYKPEEQPKRRFQDKQIR